MTTKMLKKVLMLIMLMLTVDGNLDYLDVEVEYQCIQHCPLQNRTDAGHYDYGCNYDCNTDQCARGCHLWRKALNTSCQKACNGLSERLTPKDLYCVMGCNDGVTKYFSQLKARLLTPPSPALVADSLGANSLKLVWNFPEARKDGLTSLVQWRYEELVTSWQYCRNVTWEQDDTVVIVRNLQPYTKYRFRIALIMGQHGESVVSAPSVVISTLPHGLPASQPIIVRAAPIDSTRISVSWEPGPFPHGPLLSYVLQITNQQPAAHSEVKDIPPENNFFIFRNLRSSRNYTISIRMRNGIGSGPAARVTVATPPESLVKNTQQPVLILATKHGVIEQGTHILDEPISLYSTLKEIKGIGIHIRKKLLFVSDSSGFIRKKFLTKNSSDKITILTPEQSGFLAEDLTVDWLNNFLYILTEVMVQKQKMWQIIRCDLDGKSLTVALAGLRNRPFMIEIDPYNGFLFWVIQGYSKGGLYRLDISDISNGVKHEVQPEQILQDPNLGAFTVDHTNFRLMVSNQKQNTINTISFDRKEIVNVRRNVIKSKLQKVVSLASANKKFYWTNGEDVFYEEYHNSDDSYFHNSYPDLSARAYKKVLINLESSQPIPIPLNPPTDIQAIFGDNLAKIIWQPPHLLGIQGKGAWQNWSYEISVKEYNSHELVYHKNINTTSCVIRDLKENTEYIVKAAAYTSSGKGPWSSEFRGSTLNDSLNPIILWSAHEGLLRTDATGQNVEILVHKSRTKTDFFTDIAWFKNQVYLVTNTYQVFWYNLFDHSHGRLIDIDSVGSIAVDWIGFKLYWSNPKQQLIIRGNLNGTQQEPLPILTLAKELNIDSIKGYIYWSTGYAVECAHLNGADRMKYHQAKLFSGKQVMGLTLNMDDKFVYWIVRGSDGSNLFKAPMAGYASDGSDVQTVSSLQKPNMQGSLCYFHKRLLWLQDDRKAAISDLYGKNIATIGGKSISGLNMVYVVDRNQHKLPFENIVVIPEIVDRNTVKTVGSSSLFNITFEPIKNVNYGTIFYEVKIDFARNDSTVITTESTVKYWQQVLPFTKLHVAIRAFTYWGSSPQIRVEIFSPSSTPSVPRNLRNYVIHNTPNLDDNISIVLRWNEPLYPNGLIQGYKVHCWCYNHDIRVDICGNQVISPENPEFRLEKLGENGMYFFQIQAYTETSDGELSKIVMIDTSVETPLPRLLIAHSDSISIQDIDADKNIPIIQGITTPISIAYLIRENKIFWINQLNELYIYDKSTLNKTKIMDLGEGARDMAIDWLGRYLYWLKLTNGSSTIFQLDLNQFDRGVIETREVVTTNGIVGKIGVSPFSRKIYWTENSTLFQSDSKNFLKEIFFNKSHTHCNCSENWKIQENFAVDHSNKKLIPEIIFIDIKTGNIYSTDLNGCQCFLLTNNTKIKNKMPLEQLNVDFNTLYWKNSSLNRIYAFKKNQNQLIFKEIQAENIRIFGPHCQPYLSRKCLSPRQDLNQTARLRQKTANSLVIEMPDYEINENCPNITLATIEYKIHFKPYDDNGETGKIVSTFQKYFTLTGLEPYTNYLVSIGLTNFYTENLDLTLGEPVVFQTEPGSPSRPRDLNVMVLNPNLAKVSWLPPEQFNGPSVHYEVYWQTDGVLSGLRQKVRPIIEPSFSDSNQILHTILNKLSPNETYTIWVKAYSETNKSSSDSDKIQIITYPEPDDLILLNRTAYNLVLSWNNYPEISGFTIEYTSWVSDKWETTKIETDNTQVIVNVDNLEAKTFYKFRLILTYKNYSEPYLWPGDQRFAFETLGDRPSPPGVPLIQYLSPNIYKIWWESPKDNGAPIQLYLLEGLKSIIFRFRRNTNRSAYFYTSPSMEEQEDEWITLYNGTETSWIIDGLDENYKYAFRVFALNSYGWSDPSDESTQFDFNEAARIAENKYSTNTILIAIAIPALVVLICVLSFFCRKISQPKKDPKPIIRTPDVELATLRELPRRGVHNTNILYVSTQIPCEDVSLLPHIRRDQIVLMKFLGSGAFGEVFEGTAKGIHENTITKVAVKTLKKGASDQEKSEFLKEAQLMSNFKHEHILQLLGVCLDNDPHFIIMELMQGGDLLTYLRVSRNPPTPSRNLGLIDLIKMCVDVAKGCRYLEELHFVHRDLACRNCLVSSTERENRIVKIGDFGLARDIYKNDYYRKEGEGLLPVRWMAPESLVDGVFTTQSDVWAFGVLLWEIMTLGQQPYPARNNMEVLNYVKRGGRLGKPTDCPGELYSLMLKCWEFEADKRPTFKYCLETLHSLHLQKLRCSMTAAHEGQYISTVTEEYQGISNRGYSIEHQSDSGNSWKNDVEDDNNRERTPFLTPTTQSDQAIPKYLELLYEIDDVLPNDGYEIPNQILSESSLNTDKIVNNNVNTVVNGNGEILFKSE